MKHHYLSYAKEEHFRGTLHKNILDILTAVREPI